MKVRQAPDQVVILTYNRPQECLRLLQDCVREKAHHPFQVQVWDDCSPPEADYSEVRALLKKHKWTWNRSGHNHGKQRFWQWVAHIYAAQEPLGAKLWVLLPDDVRLCERFWPRAIERWNSIDDPKKISMTLLVDAARDTMPCWVGVHPERRGAVDHTAWVDGAALVPRNYFQKLHWGCPEVPSSRWRRDPTISSGVGAAITTKLHQKRMGMYRSRESLLVHVHAPSMMNPEIRARDDMGVLRFVDGDEEARRLMITEPVTASLATIPARSRDLALVVASLLPQVDRLNVFLNGYDDTPECLNHPKITVARSQDHEDRGDAGKFFWAGKTEGYCFHCDDDLVYPTDYVTTMVRHIEARQRKAVVSAHGRVFPKHITSYYQSLETGYHCLREVAGDHPVHVVGTGVLAYHSSTVQVAYDDFKEPNMADVWFALLCKNQEVPRVVVHHEAGWLTLTQPQQRETIYRKHHNKDQVQTALVQKAAPWYLLADPTPWQPPRGRRGRPPTRTAPVPPVNMQKVWEARAAALGKDVFVRPGGEDPVAELRCVWHFLETNWVFRRGPALDFGCGAGRFMPLLEARGMSPVGVDISKTLLDLAKEQHPEGRYLHYEGDQLPLGDNSINALFISEVLAHIPDGQLPAVVTELRRVLAPRARMMVLENTHKAKTTEDPSRLLYRRQATFYQRFFPGLHQRAAIALGGESYTLFTGTAPR